MADIVLCLNGGSSSLKYSLYSITASAEDRLAAGATEGIGGGGRNWLKTSSGQMLCDEQRTFASHGEAVQDLLSLLERNGLSRATAIGHRIVHGGADYSEPQLITPKLRDALEELIPLAPLHLVSQVEIVNAAMEHFPGLPQVACFDTVFHRRMPEVAQRLPLPRFLWDEGIRRYGFHGLSYEYIVTQLAFAPGERTIIAHLGNGASMAALLDGVPVDTTMGLTPTGGFPMGTRSGDLDPGVMLYLMRKGYGVEQLEKLVDNESGLLGVSERTRDMAKLLEARATDPRAALAIEMFCYQVRKYIGGLAAALGGLDTLVFTGGIGEHAAPIRAEICLRLEHLGVELQPDYNQIGAAVISREGSRCTVRVIATNEDLMIARHTSQVLGAQSRSEG